MDEDPSPPPRVFLASTFRDLGRERDAVLNAALPHVRSGLYSMGAELFTVDLRWGLPQKMGSDQDVVRLCLEEIERSTHVLVILGRSYGSLLKIPKELKDRLGSHSQSWSIVELEVRQALELHRDKFYAFASTKPAHSSRDASGLAGIRKHIETKGIEIAEFSKPEQLARMVLETLDRAILRGGEKTASNPHVAFAQRLAATAIDHAVVARVGRAVKKGRSVAIVGPPGAGKSTIVAAVVRDAGLEGRRPLRVCFAQARPDITILRDVVRELLDRPHQVHRESSPSALARQISSMPAGWIAIDGLGSLDDALGAQQLDWLPELRKHVVVVTGSSEELAKAAGVRGWLVVRITRNPKRLREIARARLERHGKSIRSYRNLESALSRIASTPRDAVLIAETIVRESALEDAMDVLARVGSDSRGLLPAVLDVMLQRHPPASRELAREIMSFVALAFRGLGLDDLACLTGRDLDDDNSTLLRADLAALGLRTDLEPGFTSSGLRFLVGSTLQDNPERELALRNRIVAYLLAGPSTSRTVSELRLQLQLLGASGPLQELANDPIRLTLLWDWEPTEALETFAAYGSPEDLSGSAALAFMTRSQLTILAQLLRRSGHPSAGLSILDTGCGHEDASLLVDEERALSLWMLEQRRPALALLAGLRTTSSDPATRVRVLVNRAVIHAEIDEPEQALQLAGLAANLAERHEDLMGLISARLLEVQLEPEAPSVTAIREQVVALARATNHPDTLIAAAGLVAQHEAQLGRFGLARAALAEQKDLVGRFGSFVAETRIELEMARLLIELGDFDRGIDEIRGLRARAIRDADLELEGETLLEEAAVWLRIGLARRAIETMAALDTVLERASSRSLRSRAVALRDHINYGTPRQ